MNFLVSQSQFVPALTLNVLKCFECLAVATFAGMSEHDALRFGGLAADFVEAPPATAVFR